MAVGGVVDNAVRTNLLPLMPDLLEEPEPMPLYAQKLLTHLLDASPAWAADLQRYKRGMFLQTSAGGIRTTTGALLVVR